MRLGHRTWRWFPRFTVIGAVLGVALGAVPVAAQSDPPALVARLARVAGNVMWRDAGGERWRDGRLNLPLPPGDSIRAEVGGQAVLDLAASRIGLDGGTELRIDALDNQALEATLPRGEIYVRLLHVPAQTPTRIHTPRGIVSLSGDGRYMIAAGNTTRATTITVLDGAARLDVPGARTDLAAREAATITGDGPYRVTTGAARISPFAVAMMAQDPRIAEATPELVRQMTGVGDLAQYGEWRNSPEFGAVWVPRVETGWVPYRHGIWSWVAPWGWTWMDDAPWGFAPFHYGRWARMGPDWAWVPAPLHAGVGFRPAYAPALVRFLGVRQPVASGSARHADMGVQGWVPLGPGEIYRPYFSASPEFRRRLNVNHARNPDAAEDGTATQNFSATTLPPLYLPPLRPAGGGIARRSSDGAPGPAIAPPFPGLRQAPGAGRP